MKIIKDFPPNIKRISEVLPVLDDNIFCFGETIYNPSGGQIPLDILEHEKVHIEQQRGILPEIWWEKYLLSTTFRLEMELEAFAKQYQWIKTYYPSRLHKEALTELATNLATLYNLKLSISQAETKIRKYNK